MKIFKKLDAIVDFHINYKQPTTIYIYADKNEMERYEEIFKLICKDAICSATINSFGGAENHECELLIYYRGYKFYFINIQKDDK